MRSLKQMEANAEKRCKEWNEKYPVGTRVNVKKEGYPEGYVTTTRSEAWIAGCQPVVLLIGPFSGGMSLNFVTPLSSETSNG